MRTKILSVKHRQLVEGKFPNAGPCPNIRGMKKLYWDMGKRKAVTVLCGRYLYLLGYSTEGEAGYIYGLAK